MGIIISKVINKVRQKWDSKVHIGIVGLDAAGKTTLIYQLSKLFGIDDFNSFPMDPYLSSTKYTFKDTTFTELDLGYQKFLMTYIQPFSEIQGLIFVLDSKDNERHEFAKEWLHKFLEKIIEKKIPLLILANKQDLCTEKNEDYDFTQILDLNNLNNVTEWYLQKSSAIQKDGIFEGYKWLLSRIHQNDSL